MQCRLFASGVEHRLELDDYLPPKEIWDSAVILAARAEERERAGREAEAKAAAEARMSAGVQGAAVSAGMLSAMDARWGHNMHAMERVAMYCVYCDASLHALVCPKCGVCMPSAMGRADWEEAARHADAERICNMLT